MGEWKKGREGLLGSPRSAARQEIPGGVWFLQKVMISMIITKVFASSIVSECKKQLCSKKILDNCV